MVRNASPAPAADPQDPAGRGMGPLRAHLWVMLALAVALTLTWLRPLDALAERSVEAALGRTLVAFASARTLNAALSVVKEASVSFQLGAGVTVKPGAVLEPLDEVVKDFSNLLFVAAASLAAQRLLIEVFSAWPVCALLSAGLLTWALLVMRGRSVAPRWLRSLTVALLMLRLATPTLALTSEAVHWAILERTYQTHAAQLEVTLGAQATAPTPPTTDQSDSLLERMKQLLAQTGDIARQIESLRARAQDIVEHMVRLAAVFAVQTLVLPLIYLLFLAWLYRALTGVTTEAVAPAVHTGVAGSAFGRLGPL